ncbi:uncharacterized protein LOC128867900 [Anastrepha ludens]|uniref:uncharacterized protein LOC128867900 n=1 Tax=Anastrepha ludens TaxID=28586 RepID=UPI0023AEA1AC|nr:uncharacterized protein LOC128867900 [Anastrepha ludens]
MDDMIFQSSTQNSVYVLNSNYRSYGDFARLDFIDPNDMNNKNVSNCQNSLASRSGNRSCCASSRAMQNKLRNSGNGVTETIGNIVTSPPALSVAALSTTTTPAAKCLPPTAAFQNFFNCSYVANASGGNCTNSMHGEGRCGGGVDASAGQGVNKIKSNNSNKKKCANVKPSLMAKKTKFRKFIEEDKWRAGDEGAGENVYQYSISNNDRVGCTGSVTPTEFHTSSYVKESNTAESTTLTASMAAIATCGPLNNIVKHYWNGKMDANAVDDNKRHQQQNQSNNWSGSGDSNNQKRQQLEVLKSSQQQKSNYELYKEAAELLGLSCTLCDNCRCLECQSKYFDCDDSDSYSEFSNSDEYDEETMNALNNSVELVMYANYYRDDVIATYGSMTTQHRQKQKTADHSQYQQQINSMCAEANCNATELLGDRRGDSKPIGGNNYEVVTGISQTDATKHELHSEQSQRGNELENFTSFNELRLTDVSDTENYKKG